MFRLYLLDEGGGCHHWLRSGGTTREVNQTSRQDNPRENNHLVSAGELLGVTCSGLDESVALVSSDLGRRMVMVRMVIVVMVGSIIFMLLQALFIEQ